MSGCHIPLILYHYEGQSVPLSPDFYSAITQLKLAWEAGHCKGHVDVQGRSHLPRIEVSLKDWADSFVRLYRLYQSLPGTIV